MPALVLLQAILVLLALAQCAPSRRSCSRLACCTTVCCAALLACAVSADQADCLVSVGALAAPVQELLRRERGPAVPGVSCACCLLLCFASIVRASKNLTRRPHPHPLSDWPTSALDLRLTRACCRRRARRKTAPRSICARRVWPVCLHRPARLRPSCLSGSSPPGCLVPRFVRLTHATSTAYVASLPPQHPFCCSFFRSLTALYLARANKSFWYAEAVCIVACAALR
jgi:hypothetical protein